MDKLVEDLLIIEQAGRDSLAELEEERAAYAKQTADEIARCLRDIQQRTNHTVEEMKKESEATLKEGLAVIEEEFLQKAEVLRDLYSANADEWRKEIFNRVISLP